MKSKVYDQDLKYTILADLQFGSILFSDTEQLKLYDYQGA